MSEEQFCIVCLEPIDSEDGSSFSCVECNRVVTLRLLTESIIKRKEAK